MNGKYYTPYFCEENIWKYGQCIKEELFCRYDVLFLSNQANTIALLNQKAAPQGEFIVYDYHVILHCTADLKIFDFDSRLGFETDSEYYFDETFTDQSLILPAFRTAVRVIPLENYIKFFDSDRTHMIMNEQPLQPFPEWPEIRSEGPLSLANLLDFGFETFIDRTVTAEEYISSF